MNKGSDDWIITSTVNFIYVYQNVLPKVIYIFLQIMMTCSWKIDYAQGQKKNTNEFPKV